MRWDIRRHALEAHRGRPGPSFHAMYDDLAPVLGTRLCLHSHMILLCLAAKCRHRPPLEPAGWEEPTCYLLLLCPVHLWTPATDLDATAESTAARRGAIGVGRNTQFLRKKVASLASIHRALSPARGFSQLSCWTPGIISFTQRPAVGVCRAQNMGGLPVPKVRPAAPFGHSDDVHGDAAWDSAVALADRRL